MFRVLIGHEQFGHMRRAFRARGFDAWSCDLCPTRDQSPFHLQCDVLTILDRGWDLAIFHPDCAYLTLSANWAYGDGPYHQKVGPTVLLGAARRAAREQAIAHVLALRDAPIPFKAIENPIGVLSSRWRKPDQIVHPHWFGHDASKATCLWLDGLPPLAETKRIAPRMVNGNPRWANQADGSGAPKASPSPDRAMNRAETFPGLADACAAQWGDFLRATKKPATRAGFELAAG